ncbi:MAG: hypothetical protein QUS08_00020 [Methanothrix sp.]|nr:hypothetical protein [Methanothrix sp.]
MLKARAGRLAAGEVIRIGSYEMVVAEDDEGEGVVVQMIEPLEDMELLALSKAREAGISLVGWSEGERRAWISEFFLCLAESLGRWQGIGMRFGPGENMTFERAVESRKRCGGSP